MSAWNGTGRGTQVASKEELLASIKPGMNLAKDFFKRIYGYEISYPGFSEQAIAALEAAGCSKARQYYDDWVNEYETARNAELKEVAHWYRLECEKQWEKKQKGSEERRKQEMNRSQKWEELSRILNFQ